MSHTIKLWEKNYRKRLRKKITMTENQFRFMSKKSSIEAIHLLRQLIEKYWEQKQNLHMVFIDLEKAYDRILGEIMWRILEKKGISVAYNSQVLSHYVGSVIWIILSH